MKMKYLGIIFLLLAGCTNNYPDETVKLKKVLLKYDKGVSLAPHIYIIRSKYYCSGCVQRINLEIQKKLKNSDCKRIIYLSCDKKFMSEDLLSMVSFINDTNGLIDKYFLNYANLTIFETNRGKVVNVKNMGDSKNVDLPKFVNKFFAKTECNVD